MTFAADVAALLGRALTAGELTRVDRLIELAEGKLSSVLPGFTIEPDSETVEIQPDDPYIWWTPRYPVTEITTLEVDGQTITGWHVNQWGRIRAETAQINEWELNLGVLTATTISVEYDFGFDGTILALPDDVSATVASMVASALQRQATNPGMVQSESLGSYSVSYGDWSLRQAAEGMTVPDGALRNWKRNKQLGVYMVAR